MVRRGGESQLAKNASARVGPWQPPGDTLLLTECDYGRRRVPTVEVEASTRCCCPERRVSRQARLASSELHGAAARLLSTELHSAGLLSTSLLNAAATARGKVVVHSAAANARGKGGFL